MKNRKAALSSESILNAQEDYVVQSWVFNALMDNLNANLYVTDLETDRILFMNKTMKRTFGLTNPEGEICWKVLQKDMPCRCDFCPVRKLLDSSDQTAPYLWEEYNTMTGRYYENLDSLIRWVDGSLVHLQQSIDITEVKRLTLAATTDELTNMHNRRMGMEALKQALKALYTDNTPFTVCLYDVNGLKEINDVFGHAEGDHALRFIAEAVQKFLSPEDFPFRLSGDEFVILFAGCHEAEAAEKMRWIAETIRQTAAAEKRSYDMGFCYGLFEPTITDKLSASELLTHADEKMYQQKRLYHIQQAQRRRAAAEEKGALSPNAPFSYDETLLYDALIQSTDDYLYLCNMKTGLFRYPRSLVEEFGLPGEVLSNAAAFWAPIIHKDDLAAFMESNQEIADGRVNSHLVEFRAKNRRGEWVWLQCRGHLQRDADGTPSLFAGIMTNLGQKDNLDHVTGLYNKFEFEHRITVSLELHPGTPLSVLILDMDEFRHINDLYDRGFGDEILRITAQKIQSLLPMGATIYRLDSDEFGILLSGGREAIQQLYGKINRSFKHQQEYNGKKYYSPLSGGCAVYPEDGDNYLDLFKFAGYSLEYAKSTGKNKMAFFSQNILEIRSRALEMLELLRDCIEHGFRGFELYYQPQVYARTNQLKGAEALARWECPGHGMVPPIEFIPLLEESGLIHAVGRWIFQEAVATCAKWVKRNKDFTMSINISYLQLSRPDFIPFMEQTIKDAGVDASHIIVEFTETCIVSSIGALAQAFGAIRSMGMQIAMDDFGTGYSSLEILKKSPADVVKIDRAFVKDIINNTFDATFIRFIVALCHDVRIKVCLEGVETPEEQRLVSQMDLDFLQGYLYGKPVPFAEFEAKFDFGPA